MAEVYSFEEATLKRVGTASGDTTETTLAYAEGISVSRSRELVPRTDSQGVVKERVVRATSAQMSINKLYGTADHLFDGNDIKLYLIGVTGSEVWTFAGAYRSNEAWATSADGLVTYDAEIDGRDFTKA